MSDMVGYLDLHAATHRGHATALPLHTVNGHNAVKAHAHIAHRATGRTTGGTAKGTDSSRQQDCRHGFTKITGGLMTIDSHHGRLKVLSFVQQALCVRQRSNS
jgi:hypothetical protein